MKKLQFAWAVALLILAACSSGSQQLSVTDPWARTAVAGGNGAIYFVINNTTNQTDTLLSAGSTAAQNVELHMTMQHSDETMSMEHQAEGVLVPAKTKVAFEPGGYHVMLINLSEDLQLGDVISLTLIFENAGAIQLDVTVKEPR